VAVHEGLEKRSEFGCGSLGEESRGEEEEEGEERTHGERGRWVDGRGEVGVNARRTDN